MADEHLILGAGMAGLGAASAFREAGQAARVLEQKDHPGGHTATHARDGYLFDEGPHVSFTSMPLVKELFAASVGDDFLRVDAKIDNYWEGHYIRHPMITSLHGLPTELVVECIRDFVEAKRDPVPPIRHYEDWLVASYGKTYASTFPMRYTRKYHTTDASNMTTDWVGPRLHRATLDEVLRGAYSKESPNVHYVQDYRYPRHGGFEAFLRGLQHQTMTDLGWSVAAIDPARREVRSRRGAVASYRSLVSSIALPDLIPMVHGVPDDVRQAAQQLACTNVVLVNLGVAREDVSAASWIYFYDESLPFSRVSFPRTFSPHVVPPGCSSIQAEVYFSTKYRPLTTTPEACIEPTIEGLQRCGILRPDDRIVFRDAMHVRWANIIFDLDRATALATVHGYLDDVGIGYCGRYGDWGYLWSDEAFMSGRRAAERAATLQRA